MIPHAFERALVYARRRLPLVPRSLYDEEIELMAREIMRMQAERDMALKAADEAIELLDDRGHLVSRIADLTREKVERMTSAGALVWVCPNHGVLQVTSVAFGEHDQMPYCLMCNADVDRYVALDAFLRDEAEA